MLPWKLLGDKLHLFQYAVPHIQFKVAVLGFCLSIRQHWMTSCLLLPTMLQWPNPADWFSTTSGGYVHSSPRRRCRFCSRLLTLNLDYCNSLLAGVPACIIRPLQLIQNAAVVNLPKVSHTAQLLHTLLWLPVATKFDSRHWYLPTMLRMAQAHPTPRTWSNYILQPVHHTLLLPNNLLTLSELPIDIRTAETLHIFCCRLKTQLFRLHLGLHIQWLNALIL